MEKLIAFFAELDPGAHSQPSHGCKIQPPTKTPPGFGFTYNKLGAGSANDTNQTVEEDIIDQQE